MSIVIASNKIYVTESETDNHGLGRGVFARTNVKKNEIIEQCPLLEISEAEFEHLSSSILLEYIFFFGEKKDKAFLALGFGSLYNHSTNPNALYRITENHNLLEIVAIKDIKMDEEIVFNYKGENESNLPLWFE